MAQRHADSRRKSSRRRSKANLVVWGAVIAILLTAVILAASGVRNGVSDRVKKAQYPESYGSEVSAAAKTYHLDPALIYAVIRTESNFQANAESGAGARGLMQLMPETFTWLMDYRGEENAYTADDLFDPSVNIDYGCYFLRYLLDYFHGDEICAVAAYNGGLSQVEKWLEDSDFSDDGQSLIIDNIPINETRDYVKKVESAKKTYGELYQ